MENLLLTVIVILVLIIIVLAAKVWFLRRSAKEISEAFRDRLAADTNTLIDVSSRDARMRQLASEINSQLRLLRKERHRYQQGDLELKEAVTNISHDLRTPLTAISGYLDLLEGESKSEKAASYLNQIRSRTQELNSLTEELFRYSIVTSARELKPQRLDLVRALEESLLSFYGVMQERGIQPEIQLPETPVWRQLDPGAVSRVFSNIIGNGLKYSQGDLTVTMSPSGAITFANRAENLDAVTVGRLFDRFYTVEANRSSTGLGLSIARALTERMGGTITAEYAGGRLSIRVEFGDMNHDL